MASESGRENIKHRLIAYKRKYYSRLLAKGSVKMILLLSILYLVFIGIESYFLPGIWVRGSLFYTFLGSGLVALSYWVAIPLFKLLQAGKFLSDEAAAMQIGNYFPEIKDKFINLLQLQKQLSEGSPLVEAGIQQRLNDLKPVRFTTAIPFSEVHTFLRIAILPVSLLVALFLFVPQLLTQSTQRLVQYSKEFRPIAPFRFEIPPADLIAFRNENVVLRVHTIGDKLPSTLTAMFGERNVKLSQVADSRFELHLDKVTTSQKFVLQGGGFFSDPYLIQVIDRPLIQDIQLLVIPPSYLQLPQEKIMGTGNATVYEGSVVRWSIASLYTDSVYMMDASNQKVVLPFNENKSVAFLEKSVHKDLPYSILVKNAYAYNKEPASFSIQVVPDEHPVLRVQSKVDSSRINFIALVGAATDDHGITSIQLETEIEEKGEILSKKSIALPLGKLVSTQSIAHLLHLDELGLKAGQSLHFFVKVCDNDGTNGRKCTDSQRLSYKVPEERLLEDMAKSASQALSSELASLQKRTQQINRELSKLDRKLKSKSKLDWNDKREITDLLKSSKSLINDLLTLEEQHKQIRELENKFTELNPELIRKSEQLSELMQQVLDPETKKLLDELEKLLEQNKEDEKVKNTLDKLQDKNATLDKELDRALELYKNLQLDKKLNETIESLRKLAGEQRSLADNEQMEDQEKLANQEKLNETFEEVAKKIDELQELNNELEEKRPLGDLKQSKEQISNDQKKSSEQLKKGQNKQGKQSQKSAADKMDELANEIEQATMDQQAQAVEENIEDLEAILDNLLRLSFDLEELMKDFKKINQSDPRYVALAQRQLKLKEDAVLIEDSLYALAKRVFEIQSFVTRELTELKQSLEESVEQIRLRRPTNAASKQQYSMTSANNLALLLDDVLKSLQQQMQAMQNKKSGSCSSNSKKQKPGNGKPKPGSMSQMQQDLNDQIQRMKDGQKSGKGMSEELARMAAQQEMLRKALKALENSMKEKGGKPSGGFGDLESLMEETENDIVNKRITQETITRQRDILTRLLEAENALKERDESEEWESNKAKQFDSRIPPALERYLAEKQKQVEYIKSVDPALKPFYKKEVKKYFQSSNP